jgi:CRP/FNR family transcriptional regulator, cyclic AMP receptor protein
LVTFIACEFVTGRPGYENFRFAWLADRLRRLSGGGVHRPTIAALRYAEPPDPSIARADFRTNMPWYTGQKGTESYMTIEKCINEYEVSDVIFEEGSVGRELFVVLEGKIDIVKATGAGRTLIVTLGKGEFFGEMAVIDGSARSATAIAAAPKTKVMRINHARFVYLVSQQPAFALMIMDALSKRLRASNTVNYKAAAS